MERFEALPAQLWGEFMFDCKKMIKLIGLLALALLFCSTTYAQRRHSSSRPIAHLLPCSRGSDTAELARLDASAHSNRNFDCGFSAITIIAVRWARHAEPNSRQLLAFHRKRRDWVSAAKVG